MRWVISYMEGTVGEAECKKYQFDSCLRILYMGTQAEMPDERHTSDRVISPLPSGGDHDV